MKNKFQRRRTIFSASILLPTFLILSCGSDPQFNDGDTVFFPDTIAFKKMWRMDGQKVLTDLFDRDTFYNQLGLDTFELSYSMCDCPDWIDRSKLELDCKECSDFYVEPADSTLNFPDLFYVSGNTVRFYGVRIPGMNLPQGREFTVPDPPAWTVIRYYGYEVIRPYKIWGPDMKIFQEHGDTLDPSVILTIE